MPAPEEEKKQLQESKPAGNRNQHGEQKSNVTDAANAAARSISKPFDLNQILSNPAAPEKPTNKPPGDDEKYLTEKETTKLVK